MKTAYAELALDYSFRPVACATPRAFTREQLTHYNEQGYINQVELFDGDELRRLQSLFKSRGDQFKSKVAFQPFHHQVPELYDLVRHPRLLEYLKDLIGPNIVCFVSEYINKKPGSKYEVLWHQDCTYNRMDARSVIVWLALADADAENGCMWFIPAAHKLDVQEFDIHPGDANTTGGNEMRDPMKLGRKVPIEVKAGHAVFFSDLLPHWSDHNRTKDRERPIFTMSFVSADVRPGKDGDKWAVLCCGQDTNRNWNIQARP